MADDNPEIVIREARHEDYHRVVNIHNNVYFGLDYLPDMYHYFIRDPNTYCYVAEHDGQIVAFDVAYMTDGGRRFVTTAGRTMPSYQGKRVMQNLNKVLLANITQENPQVKMRSFVTVNVDYYQKLAKVRPNTRVLDKCFFSYHIMDGDSCKHGTSELLSQIDNVNINVLATADINNYLTDNSVVSKLFKDNKYILCMHNWLPLKVTEQNLLYMAKYHIFMISSDETSETLSYSCLMKIPNGVNLQFYTRHTAGANSMTVVAHLMAHVAHASKLTLKGKKLGITSIFPLDTDFKEVCKMMEPLTGKCLPEISDIGATVEEYLQQPKSVL